MNFLLGVVGRSRGEGGNRTHEPGATKTVVFFTRRGRGNILILHKNCGITSSLKTIPPIWFKLLQKCMGCMGEAKASIPRPTVNGRLLLAVGVRAKRAH